MKKCIKCNNTIEDGANFCEYCGAEQPARNPGAVKEKKPQSTLGIIAFVLSLVVSAIAGLVCGIIDLNKKNDRESKGLAKAAVIISSVKIFFAIIGIVLYIVFFGALAFNGFNLSNIVNNGTIDIYKDYGIKLNIKDSYEFTENVNDGEITAKISNIQYDVSSLGFDDEIYLDFECTLELSKNTSSEENIVISFCIKLVDDDGEIEEATTTYAGPLSEGQKIKTQFYFSEVDMDESYTLLIEPFSQPR